MGSGKKRTIGYRYFLGMHAVLCKGPIDRILKLRFDERDAWKGSSTGGAITVNAENLFGGKSREGGVSGTVDFEQGGPTQGRNAYLQSVLGAAIPAFRGVAALVFRRFYFGLNPYLKPLSVVAQRVFVRQDGIEQWYPEKAGIVVVELDAPPPLTTSVVFPFLEAGDPLYPFATALHPTVRSIGPFAYRAEIRVGNAAGVGSYSADDYLVVNGVTVLPGASPFTPVPAGTVLGTLDIGETMTLRVLNTADTETLGAGNMTAFFTSNDQLAMNPAHILRECITDPYWGMGYADESVDDDSFTAAADQLFSEGMGLSLFWNEQQPIEEFMQLVIDHIDAALYIDEQARWTLKLIRDDYEEAGLLVLDPTNVEELENPVRVAFGDLKNSVTVQYTNGETFKKASITVGDPALSQAQGKVINTTVQYPGFCTVALASRAASRELKAYSTPLFSCVLHVNRDAAALRQGDVFKLTWPKYELSETIMRVGAIALGDGRSNKVRVTCVEDVFAVPTAPVQVEGDGSGWEDPSQPPEQSDAVLAFEVPYYELVRVRGQTTADADLLARPESGLVGAASVRPAGSAVNAAIWTDAGAGYDEEGVLDFCPSALLQDPIGRTDTIVALLSDVDLDVVDLGTHAQIGTEIVAVDSIDGLSLTFRRGVLDTVPVVHAAGERIYFWDEFSGSAADEYVDGETIAVKVLPINGAGEFDLDAATAQSVVLSSRAARPYPPGNVTINGEYWPDAVVDSIDVAWSHRDRLQQTAGTLMDTPAGDIGPEAGTTYTVRLLSVDNDLLLDEATGLTGTSHALSGAFIGDVYLQLWSVRDGLASWQIHEHHFSYLGAGARVVEPGGAYRLAESGDYRVQE